MKKYQITGMHLIDQNLFKSLYVVLRTKKRGRSYGYRINDYKQNSNIFGR